MENSFLNSLLIASFLGKNSVDLEESSTKSLEPKTPRIKEVLKERKVLEKKVALSKKRKKDSRYILYLTTFTLEYFLARFPKRVENGSEEPDLEGLLPFLSKDLRVLCLVS